MIGDSSLYEYTQPPPLYHYQRHYHHHHYYHHQSTTTTTREYLSAGNERISEVVIDFVGGNERFVGSIIPRLRANEKKDNVFGSKDIFVP